MNEQTSTKPKAYNVNMTVDSIETPTSSTGKEYIRAKVTAELRGKQRPRTLVAMGKAAEAIRDALVVGETAKIRVIFSKFVNDAGEEGGEYLTAVGLPLPPREKSEDKAA